MDISYRLFLISAALVLNRYCVSSHAICSGASRYVLSEVEHIGTGLQREDVSNECGHGVRRIRIRHICNSINIGVTIVTVIDVT